MKVGMTTATATIQGLIARRLTAAGASATLLMVRALSRSLGEPGASATGGMRPPVADAPGSPSSWFGVRGARRKRGQRLQEVPGVRPRRRLLVVHVGRDRQADEQGDLVRVVVRQLDAHRQAL